MLFNLECLIVLLHHHANIDIKRFSSLSSLFVILAVNSELRVVCILNPTSLIFFISVNIYTFLHESLIKFVQQIELTCKVNHRTSLTFLVNHKQRRNSCCTSHIGVVGTECRSDMYDTCTVFCCYIITRNYTESLSRCLNPSISSSLNRLNPWDKLFVFHTYKVSTFVLAYHLERDKLVARLIVFKSYIFSFLVEMSVKKRFCQNYSHLLACITVISLYSYVVNLRTNAKSCV